MSDTDRNFSGPAVVAPTSSTAQGSLSPGHAVAGPGFLARLAELERRVAAATDAKIRGNCAHEARKICERAGIEEIPQWCARRAAGRPPSRVSHRGAMRAAESHDRCVRCDAQCDSAALHCAKCRSAALTRPRPALAESPIVRRDRDKRSSFAIVAHELECPVD